VYERIVVSPRRRANTAGDSSPPSVPRAVRTAFWATQKCDLHPSRTQIEGFNDTYPCES
jgi:hypothetical protein